MLCSNALHLCLSQLPQLYFIFISLSHLQLPSSSVCDLYNQHYFDILWHVSPPPTQKKKRKRNPNQVWPTKCIPTYIIWKLKPLEPKKEETKNFHLCLFGEFWTTILQICSYWHWLANSHTTKQTCVNVILGEASQYS